MNAQSWHFSCSRVKRLQMEREELEREKKKKKRHMEDESTDTGTAGESEDEEPLKIPEAVNIINSVMDGIKDFKVILSA